MFVSKSGQRAKLHGKQRVGTRYLELYTLVLFFLLITEINHNLNYKMRRTLQYQKFKDGTHFMTGRTIARSNIELIQRQTSVLMRQDNQIGCMGLCLLLCHGGQSYRQTNMPCTFASIANTQYYHYLDTLGPSIFFNCLYILLMVLNKVSYKQPVYKF